MKFTLKINSSETLVFLPIALFLLCFSSLCCTCGVPIPPNPANMCVACLRTQVDISEGIPKQVTVHFCKQCERFVKTKNSILLHHTQIKPIGFLFNMLMFLGFLTFSHLFASAQIFAASSYLAAVCSGVPGAAVSLSEKNQELYDQGKCDSC